MKKIISIFLLLVISVTVQADSKGSIIRNTKKAVTSPSPIIPQHLIEIQTANLNGFATAIELRYMEAMLEHQLSQTQPIQSAAPMRASQQRPWLEQQQRNFKAWKLKRQRRKRDIQNRQEESQRQQLEMLEQKLPQLNQAAAFETDTFEQLAATQIPTQPLPLIERPGVLYRGMALEADGTALSNILINGIRLQDLGEHATTKLLAWSGGIRGVVSSVRPVINLTSFPSDALYWGTQRINHKKDLLVIVTVKDIPQSGETVLYSQDIPASQITQVIIPLTIDDTSVWCQVKLTETNTFMVTPYQMGSSTQP